MPTTGTDPITVAPDTIGHLVASVGVLVHAEWPQVEGDSACRMITAVCAELYQALVARDPQRAAELFERLEGLRAAL